ncbi:ion transporter [Oceanicella actignis]|uniref:Voltage-gated potassium channel n=1 Tax=Oceanicella actignis TaxID=1189325 RepID=A0A1M7TF69_9RHOB|nr:ion transporter [Oceanicella actignis]SET61210.1 voltage-gated potassium channel [Oceanicella actignis]SHN69414.1 voltage-gated potassium channel [Oceanicella actignis]
MERLRERLYRQLDLDAWRGEGVSPLNRVILALVLVSVACAALGTEPTLAHLRPTLSAIGLTLAAVFTVEYVARLWVKPLAPDFSGRWGWLRYALRWHALIDLAALAAVWSEALIGHDVSWAVMLRLARILRIFALTRESAVGMATRELVWAIRERGIELALAGVLGLILIMGSAVGLYLAERAVQPEVFGSIPRAMWWAVATLTTVGYGDAVPATGLGKAIAGFTMLSSIALISVPAGILAAAFSDAFQRARKAAKERGPDA